MGQRFRATLWSLLLLVAACETSPPTPDSSGVPAANPNKPCESMANFRASALAHGDATTRAILEHWQPPRPVTDAERPFVEQMARQYIAQCGEREAVELTMELVRFATINDGLAAHDSAPMQAMAQFLKDWALRAHLHFESVSKAGIWEMTLGSGPHNLTMIAHADVVPPGPGWTHDPFKPESQGGKVYGRGSEDDKGPMAAALVVLRALAGLGLEPPGRITLAIGPGGEGDWSSMQKYAHDEPRARYTVGLNGAFPVTVAEDGFAAWYLGAPMSVRGKSKGPIIDSIDAGVFLTQVPGEAKVKLKPSTGQALADLLKKARTACDHEGKKHKQDPYHCTASQTADAVEMLVTGKSANTAVPERGANAIGLLAHTLKELDVAPNGAAVLLRAAQMMIDDGGVKKLGLSQVDTLTGPLVLSPSQLHVSGKSCHLDVSIHRPRGKDAGEFTKLLGQAEKLLQKQIDTRIAAYAPASVTDAVPSNASDVLTRNLAGIYQRHAAEPHTQPTAIRDATYARLFSGAVSLGPQRPGKGSTAHGPNEYIEVGTLGLMTRVYLDTVLALQMGH